MGFLDQAMLEKLQLAYVFVEFLLRKSEAFAVNASGLQESIGLVHEDGVVYWDRKLNVAGMTWTGSLVQVACCTPKVQLGSTVNTRLAVIGTYGASPQEPRAGSYKPPGTGLRRLSKVLSFSILFTEIARISFGDRKVNSTLSTPDEIGCAIFMVALLSLSRAERILAIERRLWVN
jgi:hypothetical protein